MNMGNTHINQDLCCSFQYYNLNQGPGTSPCLIIIEFYSPHLSLEGELSRSEFVSVLVG